MNYNEAMEYMNQKVPLGSDLGLLNIKELLRRIGCPQNKVKVVHIAGTNGKGSILSFIEYIFRSAGYKVGRYISPTIFEYLERFQINGTYMSCEDFAIQLTKLVPVIEKMVEDGFEHPTAFEIETALGFSYFSKKNVDVVLLETGLGGRLDATNVVEQPLCEIIASVSMDHMHILGNTLEAIAYEKAGIIKKETQVILYPNNQVVTEVIAEYADKQKANLNVISETDIFVSHISLEGQVFSWRNYKDMKISLLGNHQVKNAVTALAAIDVLSPFLPVTKEQIKSGLAAAKWPGRFEVIGTDPYVIRDGAHNVDAAKQLKECIETFFPDKKILFVVGILKDKEYEKIMEITGPLAERIYTITPENSRALKADELAKTAKKYCKEVKAVESLDIAMDLAKENAGLEDIILVFGSLTFIGAVR